MTEQPAYRPNDWHPFEAHPDDPVGTQCRWCYGWYDDTRHHTEQPHPRGNRIGTLVCNGRDQTRDDHGQVQLVGEPCGRKLYAEAARIADKASAAGWKVGPLEPDGTRNVMCPDCGKPDPEVRRMLKAGR